MVKINLLGEPRSTNYIYKSRILGKFVSVYMSNEGKALKESYQWQAKSQYKDKILEGDLEVNMILNIGTKRRCDIDNFNKLCFDSLTGIVWEDDSQIKKLTIVKDYDKENPRIELIIKNI